MTRQRDQALIHVLADPDADAPRREFADACEADGDLDRAEFVRLQLDDAIRARTGEQTDSNDFHRAQSLLANHREEWTGTIAQLSRSQNFYRGMVEEIGVDAGEFLSNAATLFRLAPIRRLNLRGVREVLADLTHSPHLSQIVSLSISGPPIGDRGIEMVASSPYLGKLAVLDVRGNDITRAGVEALARSSNLPSLKSIDLYGNPAASIGENVWNDQGQVIGASTSEEALELERTYGRKPWLHPYQDFGPWERLVTGL